jgi:hypothetical protein
MQRCAAISPHIPRPSQRCLFHHRTTFSVPCQRPHTSHPVRNVSTSWPSLISWQTRLWHGVRNGWEQLGETSGQSAVHCQLYLLSTLYAVYTYFMAERRKLLRMKTFVLFSPFSTLRRNKSIALVKIGIRHCLSHTYGASWYYQLRHNWIVLKTILM